MLACGFDGYWAEDTLVAVCHRSLGRACVKDCEFLEIIVSNESWVFSNQAGLGMLSQKCGDEPMRMHSKRSLMLSTTRGCFEPNYLFWSLCSATCTLKWACIRGKWVCWCLVELENVTRHRTLMNMWTPNVWAICEAKRACSHWDRLFVKIGPLVSLE